MTSAAIASEEPIVFTEEERQASIKRRPVMAQFFEMGLKDGFVRIVESKGEYNVNSIQNP